MPGMWEHGLSGTGIHHREGGGETAASAVYRLWGVANGKDCGCMNVVLDTDLYVTLDEEGRTVLTLPFARDPLTGRNYPGIVTPRPTVLHKGERLTIRLWRDGCKGCEKLAAREAWFVKGGTLDPEPLYVEHTHNVL